MPGTSAERAGAGAATNGSSRSPARERSARVRIRGAPQWQPAVSAPIRSVFAEARRQERVAAARTRPGAPSDDECHENSEGYRPKHLSHRGIPARFQPKARNADHGHDPDENGPAPNAIPAPRWLIWTVRQHSCIRGWWTKARLWRRGVSERGVPDQARVAGRTRKTPLEIRSAVARSACAARRVGAAYVDSGVPNTPGGEAARPRPPPHHVPRRHHGCRTRVAPRRMPVVR